MVLFVLLVPGSVCNECACRGRRLPAIQETRVGSLVREDPLEKEMATPSSILACRIPWTEEPGRLWLQKRAAKGLQKS